MCCGSRFPGSVANRRHWCTVAADRAALQCSTQSRRNRPHRVPGRRVRCRRPSARTMDDCRTRARIRFAFRRTAIDRSAGRYRSPGWPGSALDLEVETQFVRGDERRLGRTPRVEPHVVQPMSLADANDPFPGPDIRRRVSGQRKDAAFECAAKEQRAAVDHELGTVVAISRIPKATEVSSVELALSIASIEFYREGVQRGTEFVPQAQIVAQRISDLDVGSVRIQRYRHFDWGRVMRSSCVVCVRSESQCSTSSSTSPVPDAYVNPCRTCLDVRVHLHLIDPNQVGRSKRHGPDNPIPIGLRMIGHAVGVFTDVDSHGIVDANRQPMFFLFRSVGSQLVSQVVLVRRTQGIPRANFRTVHPQPSFPMRAFQSQYDTSPEPCSVEPRPFIGTRPLQRSAFWVGAKTALSHFPVGDISRTGRP